MEKMKLLFCQPWKEPLFLANAYSIRFKNIKILVMLFILSVLTELVPVIEGRKKLPKCSVCESITKGFHSGLDKTVKSNYGGGNTNWEEKSLGSYAKSEIRLVEILESICQSDKECHHMLEEHEELVEHFWFQEYGKKNNLDLRKWLCIEQIKACCPANTYGPECSPCTGGHQRPCSGHGNCDGNGTREGKGTCSCHEGYKGDLCDDCADDYFEESRNTTHTLCQKCHHACKSGCYQAGPSGCEECKVGYDLVNDECVDINECVTYVDKSVCEEGKECINNEGSFYCRDLPKRDNEDDEEEDKESNNEENNNEEDNNEKDNENSNDNNDNPNEKVEL